jgi:hypothetical protein
MGLLGRLVLEEDFCEDWPFECREYRDRETIEVEMSVAVTVRGEQGLGSQRTGAVLMASYLCGYVWGECGEGGDGEGSMKTFSYRGIKERRGIDELLWVRSCCIIRSSSNMWENLGP